MGNGPDQDPEPLLLPLGCSLTASRGRRRSQLRWLIIYSGSVMVAGAAFTPHHPPPPPLPPPSSPLPSSPKVTSLPVSCGSGGRASGGGGRHIRGAERFVSLSLWSHGGSNHPPFPQIPGITHNPPGLGCDPRLGADSWRFYHRAPPGLMGDFLPL